jgi:predicted transcriptional regulator
MKLRDILNEVQKEVKSVTIQHVGPRTNVRKVIVYFTDNTDKKYTLKDFQNSEYADFPQSKYDYTEFDPS